MLRFHLRLLARNELEWRVYGMLEIRISMLHILWHNWVVLNVLLLLRVFHLNLNLTSHLWLHLLGYLVCHLGSHLSLYLLYLLLHLTLHLALHRYTLHLGKRESYHLLLRVLLLRRLLSHFHILVLSALHFLLRMSLIVVS